MIVLQRVDLPEYLPAAIRAFPGWEKVSDIDFPYVMRKYFGWLTANYLVECNPCLTLTKSGRNTIHVEAQLKGDDGRSQGDILEFTVRTVIVNIA